MVGAVGRADPLPRERGAQHRAHHRLPAGLLPVGSISIVTTEHDQRLGDLAAGTIVARDRFPGLTQQPAPITVTPAAVATWDVSAVTANEVQAVRHFLDRRLELRAAGPLVLRARPREPARARRSPASRRTAIPSTCSRASSWPSKAACDRDRAYRERREHGDAARAPHRARDLRIAAAGLIGAAAVWPLLPGAPAARVPAARRHRHPVPAVRHDARVRRRGARSPRHVARVQPGGRARRARGARRAAPPAAAHAHPRADVGRR